MNIEFYKDFCGFPMCFVHESYISYFNVFLFIYLFLIYTKTSLHLGAHLL